MTQLSYNHLHASGQKVCPAHEEAQLRNKVMQQTQLGLDWQNVREWMIARAAGKTVERPLVKSFEKLKASEN